MMELHSRGGAFRGKPIRQTCITNRYVCAFSEAFSNHHGVECLFRAEHDLYQSARKVPCSDILRFYAIALCLRSPKISKHSNVFLIRWRFLLLSLELLRMQLLRDCTAIFSVRMRPFSCTPT